MKTKITTSPLTIFLSEIYFLANGRAFAGLHILKSEYCLKICTDAQILLRDNKSFKI